MNKEREEWLQKIDAALRMLKKGTGALSDEKLEARDSCTPEGVEEGTPDTRGV